MNTVWIVNGLLLCWCVGVFVSLYGWCCYGRADSADDVYRSVQHDDWWRVSENQLWISQLRSSGSNQWKVRRMPVLSFVFCSFLWWLCVKLGPTTKAIQINNSLITVLMWFYIYYQELSVPPRVLYRRLWSVAGFDVCFHVFSSVHAGLSLENDSGASIQASWLVNSLNCCFILWSV